MDKPTRTLKGAAAQKAILKGVNAIYEPTKLTLGPDSGSFLMFGTYGREPRIVDDGHIGAQGIEPKDEFENLVARTFRETASKTNEKVGDGTTTTMVIAGKLINDLMVEASAAQGAYAVVDSKASFNQRKVCNDLLELSKKVKAEIEKRAVKINTKEELEKIATISVGDPELGKTVADIVWQTGVDGFVDVIEGFKGEIETEIIKGMRFSAKVPAKAFVNNPKKYEMVAEDCRVLLTNYKMDNEGQIGKILNDLLNDNRKLIIIAPEFSQSVMKGIINTIKANNGAVFLFPVAVPSLRTEQFEDLEVYFDAKFVNKDKDMKLEAVKPEYLGFVEKLVVKDTDAREDAVAIGGAGTKEDKMRVADKDYQVSSKVAERIKVLKSQIEETKQENFKKMLERRIASMASAIGVIRVGASSRAELMPRKLKIEDAVYASKAALEEGYVKGGGLCLKEIADGLDDVIMANALRAPYQQIQANSGGNLEIGEDVIDPAKVVRLEVEHAVSVAANLITVKVLVAEEREKNPVEGYEEIAKAINFYNRLINKKENIFKENELEMQKDIMGSFEENLANDTG